MQNYSFPALLLTTTLALAAWFDAAPAAARVEARTDYTKVQTYSAALRYLRVDLGYEIVERDADAAYLIFKYSPPGRHSTTNGSIEIVESSDHVRVLVQLPQMPSYHETVLRDGLLDKLRREYGAPPHPKRKPDAKPDDNQDEAPEADKKRKKSPSPKQGDASQDEAAE